MVCTRTRTKDAYSSMRPVLKDVRENTGDDIIGGRTTYSGASKHCSASRPRRKAKHRLSRSALDTWSRARRFSMMLFHARPKHCHRMSSASGRKSVGSAPPSVDAPSV